MANLTDFNTVHNAFIDALSFDDIPQRLKTESLLAIPPGRDRINTAVVQLMNEWCTDWAKDDQNKQKSHLIQEVEEKRALLERGENQNGTIDEEKIRILLSDMVTGFKNGSYNQALEERNMYIVLRMTDYLNKIGKPTPEPFKSYFQERLAMPQG